MAEKSFKSRIIHKHDIAENWEKATSFIPLQGEIIVYDIDENYSYERIKIGDGVTNVNELPFADDALRTELLGEINKVSALVGDTSVAEQIAEATENLATVARTGSWNDLIDKPFGEEISLVPFEYTALNNTVIIDTDGGWAVSKNDITTATDSALGAILQGKALCVEWDGVPYEVSWNGSYGCMGNAYLYDDSYPDTGEPFCIAEYFTNVSWAEVYAAKAGTHTFATYEISTTLKTLDEKYIPDTIARVENIPVIDNTLIQEGQTADAKAVGDAINEVSTLVGDTPVSDQINEALLNNQADWAQSDETAADYVKNRTHYEDEPLTIGWETENAGITVDGALYLVETDEAKLETIKNCTWAKCGGNNQEAVHILNKYSHDNYIIFSFFEEADIIDPWKVQALLTLKDNVSISYQANTSPKIYPTKGLYLQWDTEYSEFTSPFVCDTIHKLDPKFIPWPDENDALELVAELSIVEPVAAADGSIYTDKNGVIYAL